VYAKTVELYEAYRGLLAEIAWRAREHGHSEREVLLYCIAVDSRWRPVVDLVAPGEDWQLFRDSGTEPVALGYFARGEWVRALVRAMPGLGPKFQERLPKGMYQAVVCAHDEANVAGIRPRRQPALGSTVVVPHPLSFEPSDAVPQNLRRVIVAARDHLSEVGFPSHQPERLLLVAFEAPGAIRLTFQPQRDVIARAAGDPQLHSMLAECAAAATITPTGVIVLACAGLEDYWTTVVTPLTGPGGDA
jgi:hypothetical protein